MNARADTSFAVYTGTSYTHSSDLRISQREVDSNATFGKVTWDGKPFQDAPYYGLRASYEFPQVAVSVDFTHYKMYADTAQTVPVRGTWNGVSVQSREPMQAYVNNLEISHGVNLTALNLEYHFKPLEDRSTRWIPFMGAGLVAYFPHAEGTIGGADVNGDYQHAGWGYQLFAGTHYRLSRHTGVLMLVKFDAGTLGIELAPATHLRTDVNTVHLSIGLVWWP